MSKPFAEALSRGLRLLLGAIAGVLVATFPGGDLGSYAFLTFLVVLPFSSLILIEEIAFAKENAILAFVFLFVGILLSFILAILGPYLTTDLSFLKIEGAYIDNLKFLLFLFLIWAIILASYMIPKVIKKRPEMAR